MPRASSSRRSRSFIRFSPSANRLERRLPLFFKKVFTLTVQHRAQKILDGLLSFLEVGRGRLALGCLIVLLALSSWVLCDRFTHRAFDTSLASLIPAELAPELPDDIEDALRARLSQDEAGNVSFASRAKQLIRQKNSESSPRPLKRQYGTYCSPHPPYQSALQSVLGPVLSPKSLMPPADCFRMPTEVRSAVSSACRNQAAANG